MELSERCMGCMGERGPTPVCVECGWDDRREQDVPIALPYRTVLRDQYVFGRALGHGGFGITYLGWDLNLNMRVAIKEYLPGDLATRSTDRVTVTPYSGQREYFDYGLGNFLDEGRALARFHDHPNIVTVLNFFKDHGTGYLVMSYLPGRTFQEYLDDHEGGRIPMETAVRVMLPVMDALREVHTAGMLHRDISPDNVYLTGNGQVKLIDFGAARYAIGSKSKNLSVVLKPGYAPWEQYQSRGDQGPWTDVYAVGATLYRAVTGVTPPQAPDRIDRDELAAPSTLGLDVPDAVERALLKSLSLKTADRFPSIAAFQEPLLEALDGATPPPRDEDDRRERRQDPPPPAPTPVPILSKLEPIFDRLTWWGHLVRRQVQRFVPALTLPRRYHPTMLIVSAVVTGLVGLLGTSATFTELAGISQSAQVFAAFFPSLLLINRVSLLFGLLAHVALLAGAALWLKSDLRGPVIVWGAIWTLVALTVIGMAWFLALAPMTPGWDTVAPPTRSALLGHAFSVGITALVQFAVVIVLVWKSGAAETAGSLQ